MPHYLSDGELRRVAPAEFAPFKAPIPTQIVSTRYGYVHKATV